MIKRIVRKLKIEWARRSSESYISYLRCKGVKIGSNVHFFGNIRSVSIDVTRPSLVSIGDNVKIVAPFALITHGFEWSVFREKYHQIIGSSGKINIGNNVYIGKDVYILKGTDIGDNVIIGAKSLVNSNIPSDCVAAGIPAKIILGIDDYFEKRKKDYIDEAKEYALSIYQRFGRLPVEEDFFEFFPLFLKRDLNEIIYFNNKLKFKMEKEGRGSRSVQSQLGVSYSNFINSKPFYKSFTDFLIASGVPVNKK